MVKVAVHICRQLVEITVIDIENHLFTEAVKEVSDLIVAAKPVLNYSTIMEVPYILWRVDQVVHEDKLGCYVIAAIQMTLLKRNQIEEERLGTIMDQEPGNFKNPILEFYVPKPIRLPFLELDPSLPELRNAMNQLLPPFICNPIRV